MCFLLIHKRSQHEARGGNCFLLNFQIDNDFASCFASTCALFEIMENGQSISILQKFILISTKYCQLQGTSSPLNPDNELSWGEWKMVKEFSRNSYL